MSNVLGARGSIGFKKEAVPGAAEETVNLFFASTKFNVFQKPGVIEREARINTLATLPAKKGLLTPQGSVETELVAALPHPFYWALGNVSSSQPDATNAPTVYQHLITLLASGELPSLTVEGDKVDVQRKQAGAKINGLELSCAAGELATLTFDWLAKTHDDSPTLTSTPAYQLTPLTFEGAYITINETPSTLVENVTLKIDNGLEQKHILGDSRLPGVVRREKVPKITGKLVFIDYPDEEYTKLVNATTFALVLRFRGEVISGTYYNQLEITLPAAQYTEGLEPDVEGDAVITAEGDFEAVYDSETAKMISIVAQNTVTVLT